MKKRKYMVFWDDDMGVCCPMGADPDCEGGLSGCGNPVTFNSRNDAKRAIRISKLQAQLRQAQGKVCNDDFLSPASKCLKIVPVDDYQGEQDGSE